MSEGIGEEKTLIHITRKR